MFRLRSHRILHGTVSNKFKISFRRNLDTSTSKKIQCPAMVFVSGEEMTRHAMDLVMKEWIEPNIDTTKWEFYDLSCRSRDDTEDQVLRDVIDAGKRIGSIFKEPTVTPTVEQKEKLGLKKAWGSPNGAMRRGWQGITISRDTIHITGMELGYKDKVIFERHAVGGEYGAGYGMVGKGSLKTVFKPENGDEMQVIDERDLDDECNAVVTYHNPLDNVDDLAHHFFKRCLNENVTPYVVTKKTVFKWQEDFWVKMKTVFDKTYKNTFNERGLLNGTNNELSHLISDAATMQLIRWTNGGFGMAAHNYDGDMLTDELAQVHRSPGFITSNLVGKNDDGTPIKEFEASHGTVSDMYHDLLDGKETSFNPLGMVEALIGAMEHSVYLGYVQEIGDEAEAFELLKTSEMKHFTTKLRSLMHKAMVEGKGTRDISGPNGLTTEKFVTHIATLLKEESLEQVSEELKRKKKRRPVREKSIETEIDMEGMKQFFADLDIDGNGTIDFDEFCAGMIKVGVYPKKFFRDPSQRPH